MRMVLLSIIIPVYNAKQYIHKCIQSVLDQSYQNFEMIKCFVFVYYRQNLTYILRKYVVKNSPIMLFFPHDGDHIKLELYLILDKLQGFDNNAIT